MIGRACMANNTMLSIMQTRSYELPPTNKTNETRYLNQRHAMLKPGTYYYEYCVGGKTGYTDESQYTLVSFASKGDLNLICVTFQCELDEYRYEDTIALFNWGFDNFEKVSVTSDDAGVLLKNTDFYKTRVFGSPETTFTLETSYITLPVKADTSNVSTSISRDNTTSDAFAVVTFHYEGKDVGTADLQITDASDETSRPSNLPFREQTNSTPIVQPQYVVLNAWHIIYALIFLIILLILIFVLLFINFTPQGRDLMRTRRRRKGYGRNRKLRF
jgi:D-alanyl-D-alanine carboxypeptidase